MFVKFANVLKSLGIGTGDVVSIYMPMVPELAIAMLACARLGAIHSVIFAGFSSEAIADRNQDARAKLQITSDALWRRVRDRTRALPRSAQGSKLTSRPCANLGRSDERGRPHPGARGRWSGWAIRRR